jgi:hypothetical protein
VFRQGREQAPPADGAPRDPASRQQIAEFLDAKLARPLFVAPTDRLRQIENGLQTMTIPERVFIELEMNSRQRNMHSSDYDPLR